MTDDMAAYRELGYLQAAMADVVMLVEDEHVDDATLRRELQRFCARVSKQPGVAEVLARRRGDRS